MAVRLQSELFEPGAELAKFLAGIGGGDAGAVVTFSGLVRDLPEGGLLRMEIEHYPGMTERAIEAMIETARTRWRLTAAFVLHRHGSFAPGEPIMMVATAAAHRQAAFEAAEFLMDYLKSRAPFWKRETTAAGSRWVEARDSDEDALSRW